MGKDRWSVVAVMTIALGGTAAPGLAARPLLAWEPSVRGETEVGERDGVAPADERTPYAAGILGASTNAETSLARGGFPMIDAAIGVSVPRPAGAVRLEFEGRQRAALSGERVLRESPLEPVTIDQEWTTMANVWRDIAVGEHASLYGGGGAGVGGYRMQAAADTSSRGTDPAWQVGGGATYAVTKRVTLDAGYRHYGIGTARQVEPAGEVVFAVRIADPFRGWLNR